MTSTLKARDPRRSLAPRAASSVLAAIGLVLLPKCPLCIAAYLVSLGVGAELALGAAPLLRPLAWLLLTAALTALAVQWWRVRRRASAHRAIASCCGGPES